MAGFNSHMSQGTTQNMREAVNEARAKLRLKNGCVYAVEEAAKIYGVDPDYLGLYVLLSQTHRTPRKKSPRKGKKYRWYAAEYSVMPVNAPYFSRKSAKYAIQKARSIEEVEQTVWYETFDDGRNDVTGCGYREAYFGRVREFESEDEARDCVFRWEKEKVKRGKPG